MSDATILLPNYNNERVLPFTFEKLRKNADCSRLNFLMIDDGSEDASVAVAKQEMPRCGFASCEILEFPHLGIVHALNAGLKAAKTEFILRIDGDATVETPGWVPNLLGALKHEEVGMVGGQVIWETGRVHSFGRSVFSELGLYDMGCVPLEPTGKRTFDSYVFRPVENFKSGPTYEVDTALGVCVAFRKSDAMAAGGFDLRFNPVWVEDDDFGLAMRQLGKRVLIDPRVQIVHRPSLRGSRQPGKTNKSVNVLGSVTRPVVQSFHKLARFGSLLKRSMSGRSVLSIEEYFPTEPEGWRTQVLRKHYQEWETKWGFHPMNPRLEQIFERHYDTALCWKLNPARFAASREFLRQLSS